MPNLAPSSSSTFVSMKKNRDKLTLLDRSVTNKSRPAGRHQYHLHPSETKLSGELISHKNESCHTYNSPALNTTAMQQQHSASGTSQCHERLCSGELAEEDGRMQQEQATSEICNCNIGGKRHVLRQKQQQQQEAIQFFMVRTRMRRYKEGATKRLISSKSQAKTQQWPARLLLQVALISLASACVLSLVAHQSSASQSVARNGSNSKQSSQPIRQTGGSGATTVGHLDTSRQHTFQLMRSANVELTRRSLQRLQRDASSTTSADGTSSVVVAAAGPAQALPPTCGYPGSPAHASVTFNTSHVVAGTAASYTCDNGYELLGPPRRICQSNGTWSPVGIPFCVLNVGLGKAAMQSSTAGHGSAQKAVDGSTSPYFQASTCTMTDVENNPWWYVNLLEPYLVQIVRIDFGTACCANRQKATIAVRVGNNRPDLGTNPLCNRYHGFIEEGKPLFLPCTRPAPGAFVSIHLESPSGSSLSICETFIYTDHALSIEQCPSFRDQPLGSTATYNGKCYLFHNNQALNFDGARKYCESRGGTLVDETSPALQGFLSWELYRRHRNDQLMGQYWLGAVRDTRNQQNWKWINGRDVQISFWNSLASQGNCSRFDGSKGWLWSDTDCQAQLNYICQYRPLSCGKPEKPTNSTLITKNIDNGTVIEYQCAPGNLLMGPKARNCLPTGFFSEFAPKCKYLDCQFPAQIANGDYKLLNGTTAYQSVVTYYCNEGYQLYGRSTLTCDVDERWNGPPPRCEPLLCPAPVAPSNGYVTVTSNITVPGTQATYDCRPGYELVGDRLLSCLQSGSWDNSFPYCKEKRQLSPHTLGSLTGNGQAEGASTPASISAGNNGAGVRTQPPSNGGGNRQSLPAGPKQQPAGSSIQFPSSAGNGLFSSNRVAPNGGTTSAPNASGSSSLPASLNGLAGQFVTPPASSGGQSTQMAPNSQQTPVVLSNEIQVTSPNGSSSQSSIATAMMAANEQQGRKPAQSSSLNSQFVHPSTSNPSDLHSQTPIIRPQQSPPPVRGSQTPSISPQRQPNGQQQSSGTGNKFPLAPPQVSTSTTTTAADSSPLATTNSISVHQSGSSSSSSGLQHQPFQQQQHQQASSQPPSSSSTSSSSQSSPNFQLMSTTSGPMSSSSATSFSNANTFSGSSTSGYSLGSSPSTPSLAATESTPSIGTSGQASVLASLGSSGSSSAFRGGGPGTHLHGHSLANAKYSLDGIIAVAIFGGFIFLGAIITILVIIVRRRKSSQSSSIDAQTISTYDSNGEHNGLYRNYQQAWENLRFSAPGSQPKSSGNGPPVPPPAGSVGGGPAMGMKNYASPAGVAMLHHHHHHAHPIHSTTSAVLAAGHHNMGMSSSSTTSSSSQSSSSLAVTGPAGSGGADPLLGPHHHSSSARHHQQQQQHVHSRALHGHHAHHHQSELLGHAHAYHHDVSDDDEHDHDHVHDDDDEQGVISADEANYTGHHRHQLGAASGHHRAVHALAGGNRHYHHNHQQAAHLNEGFRDSNELTINADTATLASAVNGQATAAAHNQGTRRRLYSTNSMSRSMAAANRRSLGNVAPGGQSGTGPGDVNGSESNSTRSSRASPPSDDHSLDRLAYGNNWHNHNPNGA